MHTRREYEMTDYSTPPVPKKRKVWPWVLGGIAVLFLLCGGIGIAALVGSNPATITPIPGTESAGGNVFHFGQTATVGKFAVTITPMEYTPDQYAVGYTGGKTSAYTVTVRNDSSAPVDLFSLIIDGTIEGGQPAAKIFDGMGGIDWAPAGELFPTETATFKIAFDGEISRVKIDGFLDLSGGAYFVQ